ncbi:MAG: NAD(P)/FAD-dependent oxidoreductase [Candidatus Bathyarchaeota archaeon]|nr:NAD(P)/FAD-dependent oxidoreductase [Candidatus Bathyarchaeota archaeon]MCZ2845380.1 NAD(P)/FAD-dependent oxidoreductase [Candidatus Bathyarchaeota archaeon]
MPSYDLVIVGAGSSGCIATKTAVLNGLEVCLIDCKPRQNIGDKICGDAIARHHFDSLGIKYPSGQELEHEIKGVKVYSPDMESVFKIEGEGVSGFIVDRLMLGQRLLKGALDCGVTFHDNTLALEPIISNSFVKGVKSRNLNTGKVEKIYSKLTMDASGFSAALRRNLPKNFGFIKSIKNQDLLPCFREIRDDVDFRSDYCKIFLSQEIAPGGYYWIFPKNNEKVNVGLGVQGLKNHPNPKEILYKNVISKDIFRKSIILNSGGGFVPTRRPIDSLVSDGIMFLGDAACLVNPIHGGGIGPSMLSGKLATEVAVMALSKGIPSKDLLWEYNLKYMKEYGAKQAGLDIFRILLQSLKDDEINYGMKHQLIKPEDILETSLKGELKISITEKVTRVFKGLKKIDLLRNLKKTADKMQLAKNLYQNYPENEEFEAWAKKIRTLYEL